MNQTYFLDIDQTISTGHVCPTLAESMQYYRDRGVIVPEDIQHWPVLFQLLLWRSLCVSGLLAQAFTTLSSALLCRCRGEIARPCRASRPAVLVDDRWRQLLGISNEHGQTHRVLREAIRLL